MKKISPRTVGIGMAFPFDFLIFLKMKNDNMRSFNRPFSRLFFLIFLEGEMDVKDFSGDCARTSLSGFMTFISAFISTEIMERKMIKNGAEGRLKG